MARCTQPVVREVAVMLKAIHTQENREAAESTSKDVIKKLRDSGLLWLSAAALAEDQDQPSNGTSPRGGPAQNQGRGSLSGWKFGVDACGCQVAARLQYPLGNLQIHDYETTQQDGSGDPVLGSLRRNRGTPEKNVRN